jgi:mono/diheme cytochrome c family protein
MRIGAIVITALVAGFVLWAVAATADDAAILRGKYIYDAADCGGCHGGDGAGGPPKGGMALTTPFGRYYAANITPDMATGIGAWQPADVKNALRFGVGRNGKQLFPVFPFPSFTNLTDQDIDDLTAYLLSREAVANAVPDHEARFPYNLRQGLVLWRALFLKPGPYQPVPDKSDEWNRGNYLVHAVAHCEECHTPRNMLGALIQARAFSGNIGGPDGQNAPNITSDPETGIGHWTVDEIAHLLKTGQTPDFDAVASGMKAVVRGTSKLSDADRRAIAVYLKSVPPIHTKAPPPPKPAG